MFAESAVLYAEHGIELQNGLKAITRHLRATRMLACGQVLRPVEKLITKACLVAQRDPAEREWLTTVRLLLNELRAITSEVSEALREFSEQRDLGWRPAGDSLGVRTEWRPGEDGSLWVRMHGEMTAAALLHGASVAHEAELWPKWVPFCSHAATLKEISPTEIVSYVQFDLTSMLKRGGARARPPTARRPPAPANVPCAHHAAATRPHPVLMSSLSLSLSLSLCVCVSVSVSVSVSVYARVCVVSAAILHWSLSDSLAEHQSLLLLGASLSDETSPYSRPAGATDVRLADFRAIKVLLTPMTKTSCRIQWVTNVDLQAPSMPQALVSMVTKKIAGSIVSLLVREAQKVTAIEAEATQSGAAPAVDNPYLQKVGEGGPFYSHVEAILGRYFEMFGEQGGDATGAEG